MLEIECPEDSPEQDFFIENVYFEITRYSVHYVHEKTLSVSVVEDCHGYPDDADDLFRTIEQQLTDWIEDKSLALYNTLEKEYWDLVSEESILMTLEDEYFTSDGEMFNGEIYQEIETIEEVA